MASVGDPLEVVPGQHAAGRVGRRVDDDAARPRRDQRGQLVDVEPEVVGHPDRDRHRRGADEAGQRLVDGVARVRDQHLVTRVDQTQDGVQHHALATDRDEDLERFDRESLARRGVGGDRLAQRRDAGERRVVRRAGIERCLGRSADVGRGVEVGLADLEMDDRAPLGLQRASAGARPRTRSRCRWCPSGRRCASLDLRLRAATGEGRTGRWPGARRAAACTTDTSTHRTR